MKYRYVYKIFKYVNGEEVFIKFRNIVRVNEDAAFNYLHNTYPYQYFHVELQYWEHINN